MKKLVIAVAVLVAGQIPAQSSAVLLGEYVMGGVLDLVWQPGFGLPNNLEAQALNPADPGYANPSGDHTVGALTNSDPSMGGIAAAAIDPMGTADYRWEGWVFTGDGNTRRGLIVRADANAALGTCYQFVLQPGMLNIAFRKLAGMGADVLGEWSTPSLASGFPATNSWHHFAVEAVGDEFMLWYDGELLTPTPIVDATHLTGHVGVYNFRFDLGGVTALFDDLELSMLEPVATAPQSLGRMKAQFGNN